MKAIQKARVYYYAIPAVAYITSLVLTLRLFLPNVGTTVASLENSQIILSDVYPFTTAELATTHGLGLENTELFYGYDLCAWGFNGYRDDGDAYQQTTTMTLGSPRASDLLWWIYLGNSPTITLDDGSTFVPEVFTDVFDYFSTEFQSALFDIHLCGILVLVLFLLLSVFTYVIYLTKMGKRARPTLNASLVTRMYMIFASVHLLVVYVTLIHNGPATMDEVGLYLETRTGIKYVPSDSIKTQSHILFVLFVVQLLWAIHHDRVRLADVENNYKQGAQTTPNGLVLLPYGYQGDKESKYDVDKSD